MPQRRLVWLLAAFVVLFGAVAARLVEVQTLNPDRYVALGEAQRVKSTTLPAGRGAIFDRNGNELALSVPRQTIVADPRLVAEPETAAATLAPIVGVDEAELTATLASDRHFAYVARAVDDDVASEVAALELAGISFLDEPRRFNPADDLAHALLGDVDIDNSGLSGLEAAFDDQLTGEPGELVTERDQEGRVIPAGERRLEPAVPGDDLVLSLDRSLQYQAERALIDQVDATGAEGAMAIVSRPATGEVLAMANVVDDEGGARRAGNNAALTTVIEPGSVNKVITVAAALEEGLVEPDTTLTVPDELQVADHLYEDSSNHETADWTVTDILTVSSNVGTIKLAQRLGGDRVDSYLREFGFGERTAIEFPNESPGIMLDRDDWSGTSIGSIPLGQGISVTAMQVLAAYNVIANDGVYVPPRLVNATVDDEGVEHPHPTPEPRRVVSTETAEEVAAMLANVVAEGTGQSAAIEGYGVAGKTGTARKPMAEGGYRDEAGNYHYVSAFAGFVPAEDPELSMIVVLDDPAGSFYASDVVAPVFAELGQYALRRYQIPPAPPSAGAEVPAPSPDALDGEDNEVPSGLVGNDEPGTDEPDAAETEPGATESGDTGADDIDEQAAAGRSGAG